MSLSLQLLTPEEIEILGLPARPKPRRKRRRKRRRVIKRGRSIYFVEAIGLIKIGITGDVDNRLSELQVGSPAPLRLLFSTRGTTRQEHALHCYFTEERVRGEWFKASKRLLAFIEELRSCDGVGAARILKRLQQAPNLIKYRLKRRLQSDFRIAQLDAQAIRRAQNTKGASL